jgi:chlorophyll(ide) b reductase
MPAMVLPSEDYRSSLPRLVRRTAFLHSFFCQHVCSFCIIAHPVKELDEGVQGYPKRKTPGTIQVHSLSPGMVFTQLLLDDSTPELRKFPFGVLAAQPEEVAADLVPKILAQKSNGGSVEFLTTDRVLTKFFERFILQKKSEYIDDDGNVIKMPGAQYDVNGVRQLY